MSFLNKRFTFNLVTAILVIVTVLLRFLAIHMYDIHIDELIYADYARGFASGHIPWSYDTFFLHPPGYYVLLAMWRTIFWHGHDIFAQLTILRGFNIILSGFTVLSIILLTKFVTRKTNVAMIAGTLFAIDPFAIRHNTRGLMETTTMLLLLIGLWLFFRNANNLKAGRKTWLVTGLLFGFAIVTKDVSAIFLFIAFAIMILRKVGPEYKVFRYIIPMSIIPYAIWVTVVTLSGHLGMFLSDKTLGLRRFFGLVQITGFNSSNGPSKSETLFSTLPHYASSYIVMGLGTLSMILLLTSKNKDLRRWGCIAAASITVMGYLIIDGTFEEQFLYYLLIPSFITIVVSALELQKLMPGRYRAVVTFGYKLGIAMLLVFGAVVYVANMSTPDNGWQKTIAWVDANVPSHSTICVFGQGEFLLREHGFTVCSWHSISDINAHHVQYVIDSEKLTRSNYVPLSVKDIADITPESKVVFTYTSRDSGKFFILELSRFAISSGVSKSKH